MNIKHISAKLNGYPHSLTSEKSSHDQQFVELLAERKKMQEQLERLALSHQAAQIESFEWNIQKNQVFSSPEEKALKEIKGKRSFKTFDAWMKTVYPLDRERVKNVLQSAIDSHAEFDCEFRVFWSDKSIHWVSSKGKVFYEKKGSPIKLLGINRNIDAQKKREQNSDFLSEASKIFSSSLDYQQTLESVANLAVPAIADWCNVDIIQNGKAQQVAIAHRNPKKAKFAKEFRKRYPIDVNEPTGIAEVLRTGEPRLYPYITDEMLVAAAKTKKQLQITRKIGLTSVMMAPIFSQKETIGVITFVTSETKKHYDQSDLQMAGELASRASSAIENARHYKEAQDAVRLRDDFISVASHELKTPVTSVKMFTQVLKKHSEKKNDRQALSYLSKMNRQLNKLTELIVDLLNVRKIQTGEMELHNALFKFEKPIKEAVEMLQQIYTKYTITVIGKSRCVIRGDKERIGQVVTNLISNAIKYSPSANEVKVYIGTKGKYARLSVKDFGIGISKEHLDKVFERFYRINDTITDKTFPGLGIGLYISYEIVRRHGGKLWVESEIGKGSTFHVAIPFEKRKRGKK